MAAVEAWVLRVIGDGVLLEQDRQVHQLFRQVEHLVTLERPHLHWRYIVGILA